MIAREHEMAAVRAHRRPGRTKRHRQALALRLAAIRRALALRKHEQIGVAVDLFVVEDIAEQEIAVWRESHRAIGAGTGEQRFVIGRAGLARAEIDMVDAGAILTVVLEV